MHYALSHRDDTAYWKNVTNKSFYDNRITDKNFGLNIDACMNDNQWLRNDAGVHVITTGLRYFAIKKLKLSYTDDDLYKISLREKEVNKWNIICKDKPKLIQFLKENIHKNA